MKKIKKHIPVLLNESIKFLNIKKNGIYIDGTFGNGGHSVKILDHLGIKGVLYAIDRDPYAILSAKNIHDTRFNIIHDVFSRIPDYAKEKNIVGKVNGILLDLGTSLSQINNANRGFSFMHDGPLDMRMNPKIGISASQWLKTAKEKEIAFILKNFGEERFSKKIAHNIYYKNKINPITTTKELASIITKSIPLYNKFKHPATRSFQAIRIHINNEIEEIKTILKYVINLLIPGGRLLVISFHSIEDRIVKKFMIENSKTAQLPIGLPITEEQIKKIKIVKLKIIKKILPSKEEIIKNFKARSAVLRIAEKI